MSSRRLQFGHRRVAGGVACIVAAAAALSSALAQLPDTAAAQTKPTQFLGFRVGEMRPYRLGPPESLNQGEQASWTIRLDRVSGDPPVAVFELTHRRSDPPPSDVIRNPPHGEYEDPVYADLVGEVRLDRAGFPDRIDFRGERRFPSYTEQIAVRYEFRDGAFHIDVGGPEGSWSVDLPVDSEPAASPHGHLFLFVPSGLGCLGRGNLTQEILDRYGLSVPCATVEPMFTNPGLLELALRAYDRPIDEVELWFVTPNGPFGWWRPSPPRQMRTRRRRAVSERTWPEDPRRDESRFYAHAGFRLLGPREIELGPVRVSATALEVEGGDSVERVYRDDRGRVVRIDLGDHPVTHRHRWIRLLSPTEY